MKDNLTNDNQDMDNDELNNLELPKKNSKKKDQNLNNHQQMIDELSLALKRERADSINLRRLHSDELTLAKQRSIVSVIRELLPALDNLERALKYTPTDLKDSDYVKGIESVIKQFEKSFTNLGVSRILTVGQEFNPELHEAVHLDDSAGGSKEIISEELQAGYIVNNEVIRHAMVKVKTTK